MAAVASSTMAGLVPRVGTTSRFVGFPSIQSLPRQHNISAMRVRCQAEEQPTTPVTPSPLPASPPISPPPKAKSPPSLADLLAFGGPAPERINGRLAMVGFVAALAVEAARGDGLVAQVANGGLPWFAATAALLSAASLVPLLKGVTPQSRSDGLMTADAEMWNGRFAMMGIAALAFTEYLTGGPLV